MDKRLFDKALSKVPEAVAKMSNYYGVDKFFYKETVNEYTPSGTLWTKNYFTVTEYDLFDHINRAKRKGFAVDIADTVVTITRVMSDNSKYVVTYEPCEGIAD